MKLLERATAPAKPLVAAGLPRLVDRTVTWCVAPVLIVKLVVLVVAVNPLTLIERTPEALVTKPVATWLILIVATPRLVAAVTFAAFVIVARAGRVNAAGRR